MKEGIKRKPMRLPTVLVDQIETMAKEEKRSFVQTVNIMVSDQVRVYKGNLKRQTTGKTIAKTVDMEEAVAEAVEELADTNKATFTTAIVCLVEGYLRKRQMFG